MNLTILLRSLVGWGRITIDQHGGVHYSPEAWQDIMAQLAKDYSSLTGRHQMLYNNILTDSSGEKLSDDEITLILSDCAYGVASMRCLMLDFAQRLVMQDYEADLVSWYSTRKRA